MSFKISVSQSLYFLQLKKKKKRKMSAIQWKSESELHFHLKGPFVTQLRAFFFFC